MVYGIDSAAEVRSHLPADFHFGVATSSWQIEGSSHNRGESIWDRFAKIPGAIVDGALADPACDHVGRLDEDLDLIARVGVESYRFSVSWPRFIYDGVGEVFPRGAEFYDRLVDGLLARGITPLMTCYHWDLPQALQEKGGWLNPDTGKWFADYAHALGQRYGDRISHVATLNEPWVSAFLGYAVGIHAPGIVNAPASLEVAYRLMVASGRGITALRDAGVSDPGVVLNLTTVRVENESVEGAAAHINILQNSLFTDLLAGRPIPEMLRENTTHLTDWSFVDAEGLALAQTPISWLGVNYYTPIRVNAPDNSGQAEGVGQDTAAYPGCPPARLSPRPPFTTMGWEVDATGLTDTLLETSRALPGIPLWVTENGAAFTDRLVDGEVYDPERIDYSGSHLVAVGEAIRAGADVRGYCLWSLLDNIEWAEGRTKTFGIVHVHPETLARTPKASYDFYRRVVTTAS